MTQAADGSGATVAARRGNEQVQRLDARLVARPGRQERGRDTYDRILDAAERLLHERRFDQISTNDLCIEADVSSSSLYARFPSKDAVLLALIDRYAERSSESIRRATDLIVPVGAGGDLTEITRAVLLEFITFARENDHLERAFGAHPVARDRVASLLPSTDVADIAVDRLQLLGVIDDRALRRLDFAIRAAAAIVHRAVGSNLRFAVAMGMPDDELIDEVATMVSGYLRTALLSP